MLYRHAAMAFLRKGVKTDQPEYLEKRGTARFTILNGILKLFFYFYQCQLQTLYKHR